MDLHRILCPVDFSAGSRAALAAAAELARERNAVLVLLHVLEPVQCCIDGDMLLAPSAIQDLADAEQGELESWKLDAKRLGAKEVATKFVTGVAWDRIVAAAREDTAIDLIVMGTHGRTGLKHALLGSVAEKTVRHAPCAVMVVRAREDV